MMADPRLQAVPGGACPHPPKQMRDATTAQTPVGYVDRVCGACGQRWREHVNEPRDDGCHVELGHIGGGDTPLLVRRVTVNGVELPRVAAADVLSRPGEPTRVVVELLADSVAFVALDEPEPEGAA